VVVVVVMVMGGGSMVVVVVVVAVVVIMHGHKPVKAFCHRPPAIVFTVGSNFCPNSLPLAVRTFLRPILHRQPTFASFTAET